VHALRNVILDQEISAAGGQAIQNKDKDSDITHLIENRNELSHELAGVGAHYRSQSLSNDFEREVDDSHGFSVSPIKLVANKPIHVNESIDENLNSIGETSVATSSSVDVDNLSAELEHIINNQTNVINKLREDRARFGQVALRASMSTHARVDRDDPAIKLKENSPN
jgi:hypothetical protein